MTGLTTAQRSRIPFSRPCREFSIRISRKKPELALSQPVSPFLSNDAFLHILIVSFLTPFCSHPTGKRRTCNKCLDCRLYRWYPSQSLCRIQLLWIPFRERKKMILTILQWSEVLSLGSLLMAIILFLVSI